MAVFNAFLMDCIIISRHLAWESQTSYTSMQMTHSPLLLHYYNDITSPSCVLEPRLGKTGLLSDTTRNKESKALRLVCL